MNRNLQIETFSPFKLYEEKNIKKKRNPNKKKKE